MLAPMSRLELVATLGPSSLSLAGPLVQAGATCLRLNASHMDAGALAAAVAKARAAVPACPLVIDLQGAKMRLGRFVGRQLMTGSYVVLARAPGVGEIPLPHAELYATVRPGDTLSLDDDRLRLRVDRVAGERIEATCTVGGPLGPRKGVNVLEHPVQLSDLGADDQAAIAATADAGVAYALSFLATGAEAAWVRRRAPGAAVIGKIERREASLALAQVAAAVDAVWICRGDLGAQLGAVALARFVAGVAPRGLPCPALMAGQVLEHLTAHRTPTRSEVCHLFDLVARGYAGVVLSDETAIGDDPVGAVAVARALLDVCAGP